MSGIGGTANTMTSINRPTSRVLAPPGGGSSNIFGAMNETTTPPTNSSRTGRSNEQSCNIFGQPIVDHKQPAKQTAAPAAPVTELSNFYTWEWGSSELSLEWCSAKSRRSILFETISVFLSKIANSTNSSRSNTMCSSCTNYWGTN